jgi:hypothetical protein
VVGEAGGEAEGGLGARKENTGKHTRTTSQTIIAGRCAQHASPTLLANRQFAPSASTLALPCPLGHTPSSQQRDVTELPVYIFRQRGRRDAARGAEKTRQCN